MNNKEIRRLFLRSYNPKTAFGNSDLIRLSLQFQVPDADGFYNITGIPVTEVVGADWECANCGGHNRNECRDIEEIEGMCRHCGSRHLIEIRD